VASIALAAVLIAGALFSSSQTTITPAEARLHDGQTVTVCGKVQNQYTATASKGKPTFLDLDSSFPEQLFKLLIWDSDRQNVGDLPRTGTRVCATGSISYFRGVPQMIIKSGGQLSR
jgi:exonuclease VII large subunit